MAATYDLYLRQGQDEWVQVRWSEDDAVVDLTAWSAKFQIRETAAAAAAIFDAPDIILDHETNVLIEIPSATSSGWAISAFCQTKVVGGTTWAALGVFDLELVSPDPETVRLVQGRVWISPEVSR